jgi:hypothetical protein
MKYIIKTKISSPKPLLAKVVSSPNGVYFSFTSWPSPTVLGFGIHFSFFWQAVQSASLTKSSFVVSHRASQPVFIQVYVFDDTAPIYYILEKNHAVLKKIRVKL